MKVVLLGATRGMGRSLARLLVARGDQVFLLGRDEAELARSAEDLRVRGGGRDPVSTARCDLADPSTFAAALEAARAHLERIDAVIVTAASFATQDVLGEDTDRAIALCTVDFAHTVGFCEHARKLLLAQGGGKLVVFSSVAGDRGRTPQAIYGAAKAGLSTYLEALDHAHRREGLVTVCVKPGFVRTGMTEGLRAPPFAGEPDAVAARVLVAMDRGWPVVYAPAIWGWVMLVIRWLPRFVMRRIKF
jgi:NAD(P)-dependent dehydrogenase (short-subunit alcohol dehydrogenase family)